jgi:hypothetical protein
MKLLEKLFCKHKWKTHYKREMHGKTFVMNLAGDGYNDTGITKDYTVEVLICENCGKIKKIEY